jgi:hypothetical protein
MSEIADVAALYADRVPVDRFLAVMNRDRSVEQSTTWWATPARPSTDLTREIMEVRLSGPRLVNHLSFEVMHFPHVAEVDRYDAGTAQWVRVAAHEINFSRPQRITQIVGSTSIEPVWERVSLRVDRFHTERVRIVLRRSNQDPPLGSDGKPIDYSVGIRNFDIGYRVTSRSDVPPDAGTEPFASSVDLLGSRVSYSLFEQHASGVQEGKEWRCEPQPVNYAVVPFYLDTSTTQGEGKVIDRFFIDPTHIGPTLTLYHSDDEGSWEGKVWTPIARDYSAQKGFIHLPPTRARFWKFEFTNLTAEPYESFLPITRNVLLFPPEVILRHHLSTNNVTDADLPGQRTAMELLARYETTLVTLNARSFDGKPSPTEVLFVGDPAGAQSVREQSWVYGFEPWHPEQTAPRFIEPQTHTYREVEIRHTTKIGFFIGLRKVDAYRLNYAVEDDTEVIVEHFHDLTNITSSSWTKGVNFLTSPTTEAVAQSNILRSASDVAGVQFATNQTPPRQIAPDDDFRDPTFGNASYDWDNLALWHRVGDVTPTYLRIDHSIKLQRGTGGFGGIESPLIRPAGPGRYYVAGRVRSNADLTAPLYLQIVNHLDILLVEEAINVTAGQNVEWHVGYTLGSITVQPVASSGLASTIPHPIPVGKDGSLEPEPDPPSDIDNHIRIRMVQKGTTQDTFIVDTLSLFEEVILWDFSNDGGNTWVPALDARNRVNGVVTFPSPAKELRWRVNGLRPGVHVSSLQIRPWYQGRHTGSPARPQRGPNVSTYDQFPPIWDDPEFNGWASPIPRFWYVGWRLEPLQGFGYTRLRSGEDEVSVSDGVLRNGSIFRRAISDNASVEDEVAHRRGGPTLVSRLVQPVFKK